MNKKEEKEEVINQGWNQHDYLLNEALILIKKDRKQLPDLERNFYNAIASLKWQTMHLTMPESFNDLFNDLINYPVVLRSILDNTFLAEEYVKHATRLHNKS